jgi:mycothiol synthase
MRYRAPVPHDAVAVMDVLIARDIADLGVADHTLDELRDEWQQTGFDLASDGLVAESGGGVIVGYAAVTTPGTQAVVSPEHEGQGIGTHLLKWSEQRDRERGRERHRQWVAASNARGRTLLLAAGYRHARSYRRLSRALDGPVNAAPPPRGISLRTVDVETDATAIHALNETSFAATPDYRPQTFATFVERQLGAHDFDPGLSCVAERSGVAIGFLLACVSPEEGLGFVDLLGVHPDYHRRGLATAMLTAAFAAFAAAGLREAQLGVASDNPQALRLYERCGMKPLFQFDIYERAAPT